MSGAHKMLRIGSRGSELALWQSKWVENQLRRQHPGLEVTLEVIRTTGDRNLESPLSTMGDKGLFTREIEQALLDERIDVAVHSLKDLPTELPAGLIIGAVSSREDVRDTFIPHPGNPVTTLLDQPKGATIATGSLRRKCQLLGHRPDFRIADIRGNVSTRLRKLDESDWDGMILARAGLIRLGVEKRAGEVLPVDVMMPAVGQGAIALEVREQDRATLRMISVIRDWMTERATLAERALLRGLEGGCQVPIGAHAVVERDLNRTYVLQLKAVVGSLDGTSLIRGKTHGNPDLAEELGSRLATTLLAGGADAILTAIRGVPAAG